MSGKQFLMVAVPLGLVGTIIFANKVKASTYSTPSADIPTTDIINGADNLVELDAYYDLINELYIIGKLSYEDYEVLYSAYKRRFDEVLEGGLF